jgi:nitrite reductase (NADH) large subunit
MRIRLRDGRQFETGEQAVRAWPVKVEGNQVWVSNEALVIRAEAS